MARINDELVKIEFGAATRNTFVGCGVMFVFGIGCLVADAMSVYALFIPGVFAICAALLLLGLGLWDLKRRKARFLAYLENFSFCAENTTRVAVLNFPSPFVVTGVSGAVRWYNARFAEMIGRESLLGEYLQDLLPDIQIGRFIEDPFPAPEDIVYKDRYYTVNGSAVRTNQDDKMDTMLGFYFVDTTEERRFRQQCEEKKVVECIAIIDNYDEVFRYTPNASHGTLMGEIERHINEWVDKGQGIVRRYERDKFIILFENGNFKKLEAERFAVLNAVRMINMGNRIPVTLSIGIGKLGGSIEENDKMARLALEMALGRGGDQVVVKSPYSFDFYGAKSREIEKNTKVKARVVAHALREMIDQSDNVIIMGHKNSDMDSLGAAIGLYRAARERNRQAYIAINRSASNAAAVLKHFVDDPAYEGVFVSGERALSLMEHHSLLIIVDTHRPSMVEYPTVLKAAHSVVLVDHHRRSEEFIDHAVLTYHEPYASSASEMVTEMLQYLLEDRALIPKEAEALYAGIYMDTKGFTFKTGVRTFETASYLRRMGVDPVSVKRLFRNDMETYIQKSRIITNAKVYRGNIAIAFCEEHTRETQVVVAQAADDLLNIKGIEAAFVLAKIGNKIIISGRSLESVNVQLILEKLGGGGHITIAGAQLEHSGLGIAEVKLKNAIDEVLFDE